MYYILVIDGKAHESIPEYDPAFPGIPITSRFSVEFLSKCVQSETTIKDGWIYNLGTGEFSEPEYEDPGPIVGPDPVPYVPAEMELAQQDITDLQLNDIEQGQQITDLELTILGGGTSV